MDLIFIGVVSLMAANRLIWAIIDIELPSEFLAFLIPTALCIGMLMAQGFLE